MIELTATTARAVADRVRRREIGAVEVARAALDRIERLNPTLRAFISVTRDLALADAAAVDRAVADGKGAELSLAGVPLAIKDGFDVRGVRTTAGSRALAEAPPAGADATAVARLRAAGCVVVGKASLHEFAYGFTNRNPHFGDCLNPWDTARIPGGSSGGNAVALATGMALGAVGGDTGGSIRQPAALCGVVGLKVTYGRVSRAGGVPLSWSMDTVGPMTRSVGDAAALLKVMAGPDPKDATTRHAPALELPEVDGGDLKGLRVGIPHAEYLEALEPDAGAAYQDALGVLKGLGATLVEARLPPIDQVVAAHRAIIFSEATAAHEAMLRTQADRVGDDVRPLLQAGFFLGTTEYLAAQTARQSLIAATRASWSGFDVLATLTSPIAATPLDATTATLGGREVPLVRAFLDATLPFNLTGQPALSVPCGFNRGGLPIGLQLVGRPFEESVLLRAGAAYEAATPWHERVPPLATKAAGG